MVVLAGVLVVLFVVALVLSEGRWARRRRERWNDTAYTGAMVGSDGGECSGGGFWGGGDCGGGGGDGGGC
jgi:hypothetical protein